MLKSINFYFTREQADLRRQSRGVMRKSMLCLILKVNVTVCWLVKINATHK